MVSGYRRYRVLLLLPVVIGALAATFLATGIYNALAQSGTELFDYPNTGLKGIVSAQVSVPLDTCRRLCSTRSGCAGFDHSSTGVCRIFLNIGGAAMIPQHTAGTRNLVANYGPPSNPPLEPQQPQPVQPEPPLIESEPPPSLSFNRYRNRDLSRDATETHEVQNVEQCESLCGMMRGWCTAYTFDAWNGQCFLKEGSGELEMNARAISGVSSQLAPPSASGLEPYWERFNGKAFPGSGYNVIGTRSREECEDECWAANLCMAYTFTQAQQRCALFDQTGEYTGRRGANSGAKRQN